MWFQNLNKKYPPYILQTVSIRPVKLFFYNLNGHLFVVWYKGEYNQEYEYLGQFSPNLKSELIPNIFNKFAGLYYLQLGLLPWESFFNYQSDFPENIIKEILEDGVEMINMKADNSIDEILLNRIYEIGKSRW